MIILGVGTNVGNRLANLRQALVHLRQLSYLKILAISPVYESQALLPENAPVDWDQPFLNMAIACQTDLTPDNLLHGLQAIENKLGRIAHQKWAPRIIDIDILAWDNLVYNHLQLTIPHSQLLQRPFALWPLADLFPEWRYPIVGEYYGKTARELVQAWGSPFTKEAPFATYQILKRADMPQLAGILNVTPDSATDGGKYLDVDKALEHAEYLFKNGAEIIDIGAESMRPDAVTITPTQEWQRLEPVLQGINLLWQGKAEKPLISIDTRNPETAEKALEFDINWINDVSGLQDSYMRQVLVNSTADIIIMHHLTIPAKRGQYIGSDKNPVEVVCQWGEQHLLDLEKQGFTRDRLIFDVGIGFGKTPAQSKEIMQNIAYFRKLNVRLLVGHSRKLIGPAYFNGTLAQRDIETVAASVDLAQQAVDYLRVHNVDAHQRAFAAYNRFKK